MSSRALENPIARSLAFHLILILVALFYLLHAPPIRLPEAPVEVVLMDKKTQETSRNSIVQPSWGEEAKDAKKNAFLSDKTRIVREERSARITAPSTPSAGISAISPERVRARIKLSDLGIKIPTKPNLKYQDERNWAKPQLGETLQGGQYIQGMKEGEFSALNTKEFVFYSYFERVRRQLDQAWQPLLRENLQKILRLGRHLASNADYVTRTLVVLNQKGEIVRILLLEESGTQDLDRAAVDALNRAGPYPNPPKGLIDENGTVQIRWDFILKT